MRRRFCGGVDFPKLTNKYVLRDKVGAVPKNVSMVASNMVANTARISGTCSSTGYFISHSVLIE